MVQLSTYSLRRFVNIGPGTSCDAATVASRALATANAARKASLHETLFSGFVSSDAGFPFALQGVFGVICGTGTADVSTAAAHPVRLQTVCEDITHLPCSDSERPDAE